jgi:hypothetical protein
MVSSGFAIATDTQKEKIDPSLIFEICSERERPKL